MPRSMCRVLICVGAFFFVETAALDAQVVPGTGRKLTRVGDDFEDETWKWIPNGFKSSREQDEQVRSPTGYSSNRKWFESPKRGMPDHLVRVETPPGGLPGSTGALKIQTLNSGIPGFNSFQMEQDDLIMSCSSRVGLLPVSRVPSCVTRVYLPPFDRWEDRSGTHFGYRLDLKTTIREQEKKFFLTRNVKKEENYWPGYFVEFHSSHERKFEHDDAWLLIRGNSAGHEIRAIRLSPGWWTLGMSVTPDGRVHFYAGKGIGDLTPADHIHSGMPYGYEAEHFATHFFNICNQNDGVTWSTPFIIDDPAVYTLN